MKRKQTYMFSWAGPRPNRLLKEPLQVKTIPSKFPNSHFPRENTTAKNMATDDVNEPIPAPEETPATETEKQPHKIERKWSFWFDQSKKGAVWGASLRKAYTFDTVENFWGLHETTFQPSRLTANAEIHMFKAGVEPKWEDPECANGGKWTWVVTSSRKDSLDKGWLETLMALIGEQFEEADEICGVVASVRQKQDKLSLWIRTKSNEAVLMGIGKKWKEILDVTDKITFTNHDDSRRSRFTV